MTPRARWRRITAYARASKAFYEAFFNAASGDPLELEFARMAEQRAWDRLPHNVKAQVVRP